MLFCCFPHKKRKSYRFENYSFNINTNRLLNHKIIQPNAETWLSFAYISGRDAGACQDDGNEKAGGGAEHAKSTDERVCIRESVSQLLWYVGAQKHSHNPCHHCDCSKNVTFTRERRNSVILFNFGLGFRTFSAFYSS